MIKVVDVTDKSGCSILNTLQFLQDTSARSLSMLGVISISLQSRKHFNP